MGSWRQNVVSWKKILLTTDLSEEALRPFQKVAELARGSGARIHLLHVVEDVVLLPHGAPLAPIAHAPNLVEEMERARETLAEQCRRLGGEVEVQSDVISAANVALAIADYASSHGMDLIAMSTHGRSGFRRMVMGSVAELVLRHGKTPMLVFPRSE